MGYQQRAHAIVPVPGVRLVIQEIHFALMGIALLARQANLHRQRRMIAGHPLPAAGQVLIVKVG